MFRINIMDPVETKKGYIAVTLTLVVPLGLEPRTP